jgi:hypothetical protein
MCLRVDRVFPAIRTCVFFPWCLTFSEESKFRPEQVDLTLYSRLDVLLTGGQEVNPFSNQSLLGEPDFLMLSD